MEKEHVHVSVTVLGRTNKTESNPCRLGYHACVTEYFTSDSGGHWATNPEALEKSSSETFLQTKGFSHKAPLMWCLVPAVQPWRKRFCCQMEWCTRWFKYDRDKLWLVYTQIVPVIFEPPCIYLNSLYCFIIRRVRNKVICVSLVNTTKYLCPRCLKETGYVVVAWLKGARNC